MKKYLLILAVITTSIGFAQSGFNHITGKLGLTYESDFNFEIGYEFNKKNYKNISLFFSGFKANRSGKNISNWTFGISYDPNLITAKNHYLNLKIGTSAGTNESNFIVDIITGLEYNYALSYDVKLTALLKLNRMFNSEIDYRQGLLLGIKYRL